LVKGFYFFWAAHPHHDEVAIGVAGRGFPLVARGV
jgi:hypothetical protein